MSLSVRVLFSALDQNTCRYDKLAFRIVSYFTIPCLAAYTVYSLLYETHRGWYSFIISTLTSFVYMFGFVSIFPSPKSYCRYEVRLLTPCPGPIDSAAYHQLQTQGEFPLSWDEITDLIQSAPQSVAHMPMKAMIYKTLSTVVDDLFAYVTLMRGVEVIIYHMLTLVLY